MGMLVSGEVWFGDDVMEMVATWTKGICVDFSQKRVQNGGDNSEQGEIDLAAWSVLDVGTGNGLLLQELAKQGYLSLYADTLSFNSCFVFL
ncbi:Methyltransferase domain-containing protein [Artemisia annua]|uniref:Methyltransferase domain-containing protein n=1 Tax=Artemisia annua TaxID=35608 RepID=A0A2U1K8H6_ARTAN|nr:Methyltransferase domain-containing protein [Artemisia annua]